MPDLFGTDNATFSVNQHRVSNPQQPQFPVSANIPAPMGGHVWHGCSENCFSVKNAKEMM